MTNQAKIALFIIFLFLSLGFFLGYKQLKESEKSAELSCLRSIHSATLEALDAGQIKSSDNSRELTKNEIQNLINRGKIGDCGKQKHIFENIHISIGEVSEENISGIKVRTNGDDGISGTNDDLIIPYQ